MLTTAACADAADANASTLVEGVFQSVVEKIRWRFRCFIAALMMADGTQPQNKADAHFNILKVDSLTTTGRAAQAAWSSGFSLIPQVLSSDVTSCF